MEDYRRYGTIVAEWQERKVAMPIGIGLPASIPGVSGERIVEWAKRADTGPFSSLGIIDRLAELVG